MPISSQLSQQQLGKIKFMCRRGLKELDMMLPPFIHNHLAQLSEEETGVFIKLLELDDHTLLATILKPDSSASDNIIALCNKINRYI